MSPRSACVSGLLVIALCAGAASGALATPPRGRSSSSAHRGITAELDCAACHTEDGWRSLDSDGPGPGKGFDHSRTGFPLTGRHRRAACTDCHTGQRAMTRECSACHADPHQRRLSRDCADCHGADSWQHTSAIELHRNTRLPLSGMHALADCNDCHRRGNDRALSSAPAQCYACHADDYRRSDVHPAHVGSADGRSAPFDRDCAGCHRASGWSPAVVPVGTFSQGLGLAAPAGHDARFAISFGSHRGSSCQDCHTRPDGRGAVRCTGCHAHGEGTLRAQHGGRKPPTAGRACLGCHPGGAAR